MPTTSPGSMPRSFSTLASRFDVAQQLGVGHVALLALLAAPVEGHPVAPAGLHVAVERLVRGVQLAADEPLVEGRLGLVEHGVPGLRPVEQLLDCFAHHASRVARAPPRRPTRRRSAPSRGTRRAARRAPGRGARSSSCSICSAEALVVPSIALPLVVPGPGCTAKGLQARDHRRRRRPPPCGAGRRRR